MDKHENVTQKIVNQMETSAILDLKKTMNTHFKAPRYRPSVANQKKTGCGTKAFTCSSSASSSPWHQLHGVSWQHELSVTWAMMAFWILLASQTCKSKLSKNYMHPERDGHHVFASGWKTACVVVGWGVVGNNVQLTCTLRWCEFGHGDGTMEIPWNSKD